MTEVTFLNSNPEKGEPLSTDSEAAFLSACKSGELRKGLKADLASGSPALRRDCKGSPLEGMKSLLDMYGCRYVCMHACMHGCLYVRMYALMHVRMHVNFSV